MKTSNLFCFITYLLSVVVFLATNRLVHAEQAPSLDSAVGTISIMNAKGADFILTSVQTNCENCKTTYNDLNTTYECYNTLCSPPYFDEAKHLNDIFKNYDDKIENEFKKREKEFEAFYDNNVLKKENEELSKLEQSLIPEGNSLFDKDKELQESLLYGLKNKYISYHIDQRKPLSERVTLAISGSLDQLSPTLQNIIKRYANNERSNLLNSFYSSIEKNIYTDEEKENILRSYWQKFKALLKTDPQSTTQSGTEKSYNIDEKVKNLDKEIDDNNYSASCYDILGIISLAHKTGGDELAKKIDVQVFNNSSNNISNFECNDECRFSLATYAREQIKSYKNKRLHYDKKRYLAKVKAAFYMNKIAKDERNLCDKKVQETIDDMDKKIFKHLDSYSREDLLESVNNIMTIVGNEHANLLKNEHNDFTNLSSDMYKDNGEQFHKNSLFKKIQLFSEDKKEDRDLSTVFEMLPTTIADGNIEQYYFNEKHDQFNLKSPKSVYALPVETNEAPRIGASFFFVKQLWMPNWMCLSDNYNFVLAHELGHALQKTFEKISNSDIDANNTGSNIKNFLNCIKRNYSDCSKNDNCKHFSEDFADAISNTTYDDDKSLNWCTIVGRHKAKSYYDSYDYENYRLDSRHKGFFENFFGHSTDFRRVLNQAIYKNVDLPDVCKSVIKNKSDKYGFQKCTIGKTISK